MVLTMNKFEKYGFIKYRYDYLPIQLTSFYSIDNQNASSVPKDEFTIFKFVGKYHMLGENFWSRHFNHETVKWNADNLTGQVGIGDFGLLDNSDFFVFLWFENPEDATLFALKWK